MMKSSMTVADPVPAASVAVFRHGELLLIRRGKMPYLNYWTLPGGVLEPNETAEEAARRELAEETGLVAGDLHFVTLHEPETRHRRYAISVFLCTHFTGIPRAGDDAAEIAWQDASDLDGLAITPGTPEIIQRAYALSLRLD
jgi:8-oxo-dGTP diphosphatase